MNEMDNLKLNEYAYSLENSNWVRERLTEDECDGLYKIYGNSIDQIIGMFSNMEGNKYLFPDYFYPNRILRKFETMFENNPYYYASGYEEKPTDKCIYSCRPEGYLIRINGNDFPIGYLYEKFEDTGFENEIKIFLADSKKAYIKNLYFPLLKKIHNEENKIIKFSHLKVKKYLLLFLTLILVSLSLVMVALYAVKLGMRQDMNVNMFFYIFVTFILIYAVYKSAVSEKIIFRKYLELRREYKSYLRVKKITNCFLMSVEYIKEGELDNCFLKKEGNHLIKRFPLSMPDYNFLHEYYELIDEKTAVLENKNDYNIGLVPILAAFFVIIMEIYML